MLSFRNYESLLPYIKDKSTSTITTSNIIQPYNSIKVYQSLKEYMNDTNNIQKYNYSKIRVLATPQESKFILSSTSPSSSSSSFSSFSSFLSFSSSSLETPSNSFATTADNSTSISSNYNSTSTNTETYNFPDNVEFNLSIFINDIRPFNISNQFKFKVNQINISNVYSKTIKNDQLFKQISDIVKPKIIKFSPFVYGYITQESTLDISPLLTNNSNLKDFKLNGCCITPDNYSKLNNKESSLKILSIPLNYFKILNTQSVDGWNSLIKTISTNSKLKVLALDNIKDYNEDFDDQDPLVSELNDFSLITKGFKSILTSPTCSIELLQLSNIDFYDQHFKEALINNKSISSIILFSSIRLVNLIESVLPFNKTIRNLTIGYVNIISSLESILKEFINNNQIELYSLSINISTFKSTLETSIVNILESIKTTTPSFCIKEFNFNMVLYSNNNNYISNQKLFNDYIINFNYYYYNNFD